MFARNKNATANHFFISKVFFSNIQSEPETKRTSCLRGEKVSAERGIGSQERRLKKTWKDATAHSDPQINHMGRTTIEYPEICDARNAVEMGGGKWRGEK